MKTSWLRLSILTLSIAVFGMACQRQAGVQKPIRKNSAQAKARAKDPWNKNTSNATNSPLKPLAPEGSSTPTPTLLPAITPTPTPSANATPSSTPSEPPLRNQWVTPNPSVGGLSPTTGAPGGLPGGLSGSGSLPPLGGGGGTGGSLGQQILAVLMQDLMGRVGSAQGSGTGGAASGSGDLRTKILDTLKASLMSRIGQGSGPKLLLVQPSPSEAKAISQCWHVGKGQGIEAITLQRCKNYPKHCRGAPAAIRCTVPP